MIHAQRVVTAVGFWMLSLAAFPTLAVERPIKIAMIGDSTMASYAKPPEDRPTLTGWGQVFGVFFNDKVTVLNHAQSGRSSKSFLREGRWEPVLREKPDFVFIQFGHNDQPGKGDRTTDPNGDFQDNLRKYIDESLAAGAQPVLVTPVARRIFDQQGKATTTLSPYADAMQKVAAEKKVPLVDLHAASFELFNKLGDAASADLSASARDRTHFSDKGARAVAKLVADQLPKHVPALRGYLLAVTEPQTSIEPMLEKIDLFESGKDDYALYRIPGIVVTKKGTVLAYCEARRTGKSDWDTIDLMLRRSTDGGKTWSPRVKFADVPRPKTKNPVALVQKLANTDDVTYNNPVAFANRDGSVQMLFCLEYCRCFSMRSDDDGVTWTKPVEITATFDKFRPEYDWKVLATGPGHGIQLKSGRLVVPVWLSTGTGGHAHRPSVTTTIFSDDNGQTWQRGDIAVPNTAEWINPNETVVVQLADGQVMLNVRSESKAHRRLITIGPDGATGWSKPRFDDALLEPICMGSIIRLSEKPASDKNRIVFANPHNLARADGKEEAGKSRDRKNVSIKLSEDEGQTWRFNKVLEEGFSAYSDLAVLPDGTILCFYERGRRNKDDKKPTSYSYLTVARFNLEWLSDGKLTRSISEGASSKAPSLEPSLADPPSLTRRVTSGQTARATSRYPLSYPPRLPDGKSVVTERSSEFLKPGPNLRDGVEIARTPPTVDFAFYPEQNYPGNPWSHRSDGIVVGDIYYSSSNDHLAPRGTAHLWEYDAAAKQFRLLCDTTKFLESVNAFPETMNYRPGEMQSRIDLGSDGWLYYATDRGSPTVTDDAHGYLGEWVLRTHPRTRETEIVSTFPVAKHTLPASVLDPQRMLYYGGTAPGKDSPNQKVQFFVLDVMARRVKLIADDGPTRTLIFSSSTGRVFWEGKMYDPDTNTISPANVPHVRSATRETPQGIVYGTSETRADLWAFNVRTGELKQLGNAAVAKQEYIASIEADPSGRYLYYVPGAHGGAADDGTPVVQFDLKTGQRKVLAFLHDLFWNKYDYALDGSFGSALDERGERLFISWDGFRRGQPRGTESAAITVLHIPAEERPL
jgi:sialidase-1